MLTLVCRPMVSICHSFFLRKLQLKLNKILTEFGRRVRRERLKKNLSQEELGYRAGLHRTYIGMIERGEKNITLGNITKIAKALKIPIGRLFENE